MYCVFFLYAFFKDFLMNAEGEKKRKFFAFLPFEKSKGKEFKTFSFKRLLEKSSNF